MIKTRWWQPKRAPQAIALGRPWLDRTTGRNLMLRLGLEVRIEAGRDESAH
jgi:hypothetical protein